MISKEELGHDSLKNHLEFWDFMACGMQGQQDLFPVHGLWRSHSSCWAGGDPAAPNGTMEILQLCRASWLDKESPKFMTLERAGGSLSLWRTEGGPGIPVGYFKGAAVHEKPHCDFQSSQNILVFFFPLSYKYGFSHYLHKREMLPQTLPGDR